MKQYLDLCRFVKENGKIKTDRTGTGTVSYFGYQARYDLEEGFPLLTTKKVHLKSIIHELLWFISGDTNIKYLVSKNYNVSIEGMCWMQGESDASSYLPSYNYEMHLQNFITDIRKEFSQYASRDGIAFIDAYIAESTGYWPYSEMVNKAKKNVAKMSYYNYVIDTEKEGLNCTNEPFENPDRAHYDSLSQIKLGNLFAQHLMKYIDK